MAVEENSQFYLKLNFFNLKFFKLNLRIIFVVDLKNKGLDKNWTGNCNAGTADRVHWPCVPHTNNLIQITN